MKVVVIVVVPPRSKDVNCFESYSILSEKRSNRCSRCKPLVRSLSLLFHTTIAFFLLLLPSSLSLFLVQCVCVCLVVDIVVLGDDYDGGCGGDVGDFPRSLPLLSLCLFSPLPICQEENEGGEKERKKRMRAKDRDIDEQCISSSPLVSLVLLTDRRWASKVPSAKSIRQMCQKERIIREKHQQRNRERTDSKTGKKTACHCERMKIFKSKLID